MQIENVKISPAEVKNFPTALKWRRHAFGMDYEEVSELLGGEYTSLQVYNWGAGMSLPSDEEKATILATLAYVQSEILAAYENIFTTSRPAASPRRRCYSAPRRKRTTRLFIAKWLRSCP